MKKKVIVFIDGFNLYHVIKVNPEYRKYKWLDLSKLATLYITKNEIIIDILYFTALATWNPNKVKKHLSSAIFENKIKINNNEFIVCPPEWT
jgi:hypothetical protein